MDESTAELVRRAQCGDCEAFAVLYDRHARLVRAVCYDATGDAGLAEDQAQDVFLRVYQKLVQLREPERFVPWLAEIARRVGRDWRRRPRRQFTGDLHALNHQDVSNALADEQHDQLDALRCALRALPDRERLALHLFYLEEQPAETARRTLGLSPAGFYKLLDRARRRTGEIMRRNQETCR